MRVLLAVLCLCFSILAYGQKEGYNWAFGDSVGLNFNTSPPTVDTSYIMMSMEPSASISDKNGNLLFYVGSMQTNQFLPQALQYVVRSSDHTIMAGGDSLAGHTSITQGILILPFPGDTNLYYIFHINNGSNWLYYSIVNKSLNNGLGAVVSANNLLKSAVSEKMHAVKAGNGRDWWIVTSNADAIGPNVLYKYKLDSTGVHDFGVDSLNTSLFLSTVGQLLFSPNGDYLLYTGGTDTCLLIQFDRCVGSIDSITPIVCSIGSLKYGASFSPSGRYIYLSAKNAFIDTLWQYDTHAPIISASKQLIGVWSEPDFSSGQHMLGPNGKIYITKASFQEANPPDDSLIKHLSIIHYPDSSGIGCNFQPFSYYLGGRKSLGGLPNMPNYNLGPLENINCDTILSVNENEILDFRVFPNPGNGMFEIEFLTYSDEISIDVYTLMRKLVFNSKTTANENHSRLDLTCLPNGLYLLQLTNEGKLLGCRKVLIVK